MQSTTLEAPLIISPELRRGAARRRWLLAGAVVAALAGAAATATVRARSETTRYGTAVVERRTITRMVDVSGNLDVLRRVEVPALVSGQLVSVLVRAGERVTQGQPLAVLDGRARMIAARAAEAGLSASGSKVMEASAVLAAATETRARIERLHSRELTSESEVEVARAAEARAGAVLATARAERLQVHENLRAARLSESLSSIAAPIAGIVLQAPEASGATVGPERGPLFVLGSSLDTLRVEAEVAESEVGELKPGQVAEFSVPAHADRIFAARVEHLGVDARRTAVAVRYPVELRADNPDGLLLPGMTATVHIAVARVEGVLATRDAALRFQPEAAPDAPARSRVWRITPGGLEAVSVSPGLSDGAFTELRFDKPAALEVGAQLALSVLVSEPPKAGGPGIRLGNR